MKVYKENKYISYVNIRETLHFTAGCVVTLCNCFAQLDMLIYVKDYTHCADAITVKTRIIRGQSKKQDKNLNS